MDIPQPREDRPNPFIEGQNVSDLRASGDPAAKALHEQTIQELKDIVHHAQAIFIVAIDYDGKVIRGTTGMDINEAQYMMLIEEAAMFCAEQIQRELEDGS